VLFWKQVHKGKFYGINFNRQKIIGRYIVDFYVPSLSLVIEIEFGLVRLSRISEIERFCSFYKYFKNLPTMSRL